MASETLVMELKSGPVKIALRPDLAPNHVARIKELAERYATPLPKLSEEIEVLSGKVDAHLQKMGFVW